jgi:dihydrolipoamide dehydrogenase
LVEDAGLARFLDPHTVALSDGRRWSADRIVIAVGGHPGRLSIPGAELALTYTDIRTLTALPKRVAVIGGADTGCQLVSIFSDFGCEVLLIENAPRLNPRADADISDGLGAAFVRRGIEAATGAGVQRLVQASGGIEIRYHRDSGQQVRLVDAVFFAVGWPASVEGLDLNAAGVVTERGFIRVNDYLQANVPHIFAAGDANGRSMLVPSARHEGRLAAENALLGARRSVALEVVPTGSFTDPEYGSVGLTEAQARERYDCAVAVARYDSLARPVIDARAEGFCKLIAERKRRYILGAHVLGEYSAEIIQAAAVAMAANMRVEQLADLQLAFPTFTEALGVAAQMLARELGVARVPVV